MTYRNFSNELISSHSDWDVYRVYCRAITKILAIETLDKEKGFQSFLILAQKRWLDDVPIEPNEVVAIRIACRIFSNLRVSEDSGICTDQDLYGRLVQSLFDNKELDFIHDVTLWIDEIVDPVIKSLKISEKTLIAYLKLR